jgi:hypothetical protein
LSATLSVALKAPVVDGVNVTLMVQVAAIARLTPQLLVEAKEPAFAPPIEIPPIESGPVPGFDSVMDCAAVVTPTVVLAKVTLLRESTACGVGGARPVPETVVLWGEPAALSVTVTDAVAAEATVGVKMTATLQEDPAARVVPQVPATAKDVGFVPVSVMLVMFSAAFPVFERVMFCAGLDAPTTVFASVNEAGERLTTGAGAGMPVPLNATLCGEPVALSAILIAAE